MEMGLGPNVERALTELGFENPTPIQAECIPFILSSPQDLIALAQTGTGKTAAFSLPVIAQLDEGAKLPQVLILCPTRELCLQISRDIENYTKYLPHIRSAAVYGGERIDIQLRKLRDMPQIIVGTPGRVQDMINKKKLKLEELRWVVLDEADEMLNMGFKEEIDGILESTPEDKQTLLFSATMPSDIEAIAKNYMVKPERISVSKRNEGSSNIQHQYYVVHGRDRYLALRRVIDMSPDMYGIIFCRTRRDTQELSDQLLLDGYSAEAIHGELTQEHRTYVMNRFRKRQISFLVATDVAARGIDVSDLTHVINYTLPDNVETYVHRSGRTGRADKAGVSIAIVHMKEVGKIRLIEKISGKQFTRAQVPSAADVRKRQIAHFVEKVAAVEYDENKFAEFFSYAKEHLSKLTKEKLIEHFVAMECQQLLEAYENAPDLNVQIREGYGDRGGMGGRGRSATPGDMKEIKLNVGKKHNIGVKDIFNLINKQRSLKGAEIGKIKIIEAFTFIEIEAGKAKDALRFLTGEQFRGHTITARMNEGGGDSGPSRGPRKERDRPKRGGKHFSNPAR